MIPAQTDNDGAAKFDGTIQTWGNSLALRITRPVSSLAKIDKGDKVDIVVVEDGILIRRRAKPKTTYKLADLIAQCDLDAAPPKDMDLWHTTKPVGNEVW